LKSSERQAASNRGLLLYASGVTAIELLYQPHPLCRNSLASATSTASPAAVSARGHTEPHSSKPLRDRLPREVVASIKQRCSDEGGTICQCPPRHRSRRPAILTTKASNRGLFFSPSANQTPRRVTGRVPHVRDFRVHGLKMIGRSLSFFFSNAGMFLLSRG